MKSILTLLFLLSFAAADPVSKAMVGILPDGGIDKEKIQKLYYDGEFQQVLVALEHFRKHNPDASREDHIFMYKYLSVIYAANPDTRDKAESYMYQLVKLVPAIDLLDMYITDSIKALLEKVRAEYQARHKKTLPPDAGTVKKPGSLTDKPVGSAANGASDPPDAGEEPSGKAWIWWTAGGVVVAGAVAAFLLLSYDKPDRPYLEN